MLRALRDIVGDAHVFDDPSLTERYRTDWTRRFTVAQAMVVRPGSTQEVAAVAHVCRSNGVAIVPQGGNTGLVGGGVPLDGEIVLSLERMHSIGEVNAVAGSVVVEAGATLAAVQKVATAAGWTYGVDIAARDSATIGGNIATNAGGLRVLRYGDTRRQLVGVELVTGTDEVISSLSGTLRDNTGYHLSSLVCGSEGTLGIVTRAVLRLSPTYPHRATALLRFDDVAAAANAAESLRRHVPNAESVELFFGNGVALVCEKFNLAPPFASVEGGYVLVEASDSDDPTDQLAAAVESLSGVADVAVATDDARRRDLWQYRELHTDAISRTGIPHKLDVAVPPGTMANFLAEVGSVVERIAPGASVFNFGHAGEAAVHVNIVGPSPDDYAADDAVLQLVTSHGGSVSAEHGIGRAKRAWITHAYEPAELELRRSIKAAFDPDGVMNPAVLL